MALDGILALISFVVWVVLSYVVFHHAEDNGYSPWLWAIVVFVFGLFGLIAYGIRNIV